MKDVSKNSVNMWLLATVVVLLLLLPSCLTKVVYLRSDQKIPRVAEFEVKDGSYQVPKEYGDWWILSPGTFSSLYQCCYEEVETKKKPTD
jgi:hypothetical protein